jgi:hypothetical protein
MKLVCLDCITDEYLRQVLEPDAELGQCDYCGADRGVAERLVVDVAELAERVRRAVFEYFDIPENELYRDPESETGWAGKVEWGPDVIHHQLAEFTDNDELREYIADDYCDLNLCERNYGWSDPDQTMVWAWDSFARMVKHEARFFVREKPVGRGDRDGGEVPGQRFLESLSDVVRSHGLVTDMGPHN